RLKLAETNSARKRIQVDRCCRIGLQTSAEPFGLSLVVWVVAGLLGLVEFTHDRANEIFEGDSQIFPRSVGSQGGHQSQHAARQQWRRNRSRGQLERLFPEVAIRSAEQYISIDHHRQTHARLGRSLLEQDLA